MNKIFLLTALSLQLNSIFSQDITVSVKKGKVIINDKEFSNSYPKKILKTDKISASTDAILLIRKSTSAELIKCPCSDLSFAQISKKLSSSKAKVTTYTNVVFNKPLQSEVKPQKGGVSRGTGGEIDTFSINIVDSAWIMNDLYRVEWHSDFESTPLNIGLYSQEADTPIEESSKKYIDLKTLKAGWYHIDLKIQQKGLTESWDYTDSYIFYVPTPDEKEQVLMELKGISEELKQFEDEEFSKIILDSYKKEHHLVGLSE